MNSTTPPDRASATPRFEYDHMDNSVDALRLARLLAEAMPAAQAARLAARHYDVDRRTLYRALGDDGAADPE